MRLGLLFFDIAMNVVRFTHPKLYRVFPVFLSIAHNYNESHPDFPSCCTDGRGNRTDFWRRLSWNVGDDTANSVCRAVDVYCHATGVSPRNVSYPTP